MKSLFVYRVTLLTTLIAAVAFVLSATWPAFCPIFIAVAIPLCFYSEQRKTRKLFSLVDLAVVFVILPTILVLTSWLIWMVAWIAWIVFDIRVQKLYNTSDE